MSQQALTILVALALAVISLALGFLFFRMRGKESFGLKRRHVSYNLDKVDEEMTAGDVAERAETAFESSMRDRLRYLGFVASGAFGILALRLWGVQFLSGETYSTRAENNRTREVTLRASRGRILDRNGKILVENRLSIALVAERTVLDDTRLMRRISNLLGMPEVAIRRNIQSATEGAQSARTITIDVPDAAVAYVVEHPSQFPGVTVESRSVRYYPYGSTACHLLGYTGSISSEELERFANDEDNQIDYQAGDMVGKSGVEYEYESVLQGVRGSRTVYVDASGDVTGVVSEIPSVPGSDVRLTIDLDIQRAAEQAIITGIEVGKFLGYKPTGGACLCMQCKTGEVLAMASYPNFDPTAFVGGISVEEWARLVSEESKTPLLNRVVEGLYPAASTIKPLTACAALESKLANSESTYDCTGFWTGFGEEYGMFCWEHDGHGVIDLHRGITDSCDTVFYEIAKAFYESDNPEGIQKMYRRWGLGSLTNVDLPGEYKGRIPDAEWKWDWYTWADDAARIWQPGDTANIAIGQGDVLVTPLQMCYVYCGLANGGVEMWPHVLLDILTSDSHEPLVRTSSRVHRTVMLDPSILTFVREGMLGVVEETVLGEYFDGLPVSVMGKSGTGEAGDDPDNTHAWFIACAPAENPEYIVATLIEHGGGGGDVATHCCRQVLGAIYDVPMTSPIPMLIRNNVSRESVRD